MLSQALTSDERQVRPCPVCGSVAHEVLFEQRFEVFAAGSITDVYDVVACRSCGMCFASGLPDARRFAEYFEQSSKYDLSVDGAEVSLFDAERYRDEADFIAANITDRSVPVLDIGTATGDLLVALRDLGFSSVHGVEPSPEAARKAQLVRTSNARRAHSSTKAAGEAAALCLHARG